MREHSRQMKSSEIRALGRQLPMMQLHFPPSGPPEHKKSNRYCLGFKVIFFGARAASLIGEEELFPAPH